AALRSFLAERLPEWMLPAAFVFVGAFPLDPNGKIDRRALPEPEEVSTPDAGRREPPRTPIERTVADIWADVLELPHVGIFDDFFTLGGHSLLATRVASRIRRDLGVELPLRALLEHRTVASLAAVLERTLDRPDSRPAPVQSATAPAAPPIRPGPPVGEFPLSFAQQRLWFFDQMVPALALYNIPATVRITGPLKLEALEEALTALVRRHASLRTTFRTASGRPVQVVSPMSEPVRIRVENLEGLPPGEKEARAGRLAVEEARRPFDLTRGPLFRILALRLDDEDHVLVLTMHHIISDGWSMAVFTRETALLYDAILSGKPSPLADIPIQYSDFARWQRESLQGDVLDRQLAYWKDRLTGLPPLLELPTDRPRPAVQTYRGALLPFTLPPGLAERLRDLCLREEVSLFMVLSAALKALLHRYTGRTDIAVGAAIANRTRAELEGLIGFFVNTLVLRTDLSGDPTFRKLLARERDTALEAYAHQDVPFERVVDALQPERSLSYMPIVQVLVSLQNVPAPELRLSGVTVRDLEVDKLDTGTAKADLVLLLEETPDGLAGTVQYATDLFDAATVERMVTHFRVLLEGLVADPARRLSELPLLDEAEFRLVTVECNRTRVDYPRDRCVHELFADQVSARPGVPAVVAGERILTYEELDRLSTALALRLVALGVGPETLVGLCAERSPDLIVALLGILKAGGAYVPLDPDYPAERLGFMLEDTGARVVLTEERLLPLLAGFSPRTALLLLGAGGKDPDRDLLAAASLRSGGGPRNPEPGDGGRLRLPAVSPDNLAYVIYTSGSTGRPKGVAVPHRAVVRLVRGANYAHLVGDEVFLQFAPVSFDASTFEVWGALLSGARLVVMPPGRDSLDELGPAVRQHGVTTLWATTGVFNLLVDERLEDLAGLRQLLFGGEAASPPHAYRAAASLPGCRVVNCYGPTENTTFSSFYRIEAVAGGRPPSRSPGRPRGRSPGRPPGGSPGWPRGSSAPGGSPGSGAAASVPIGRPVSNTTLYVLDSTLRPVPLGVPGELYAGGDGLARGYHARPALTAERFVPDPFAVEPGARLYRTGDVVRRLGSGDLEFLGRRDFQVKIRGFRVELGEIEAALLSQADVREAVVLAREDRPGERRLVAYVVPDATGAGAPGRDATLSDSLRARLRARLPEWMVPSAVVVLASLPLDPNGKVDRRALPPPSPDRSEGSPYVTPRSSVEETLAAIWSTVLEVDPPGVNDDFFALGGHSLTATQVVSRIRDAFGVDFPLRRLFESPTVAGLAAAVEELLAAGKAGGGAAVTAGASTRGNQDQGGNR
ncbi:MAG: condensation domain-containing protein, partial [Bacillota bacterium]